MINLNNLNGIESWPCHGFLGGHDILDAATYASVKQLDYTNLKENLAYANKRRTINFAVDRNTQHANEAMQTLQNLANYLDNFELLEHLISKSFTDFYNINNVWAGGIDTVRRLYRTSYLTVTEDQPFTMHPHTDNRMVIANIQIYLDPYNLDIGTTFHETGNWENKRTLPFIPNTGYFLVNSDLGVHSVVNEQPLPRRSLLMGWVI
jgi:hypothetical protein